MSRSRDEERFPYVLQEVADALRDERPALTPIELDHVKLRAMGRARRSSSRGGRRPSFMRARLTTLLTAAFLILGTGGALAMLGGGAVGSGGSGGGSASWSQYHPC